MRHDSAYQFNLVATPPPPKPPAWLQALLQWLGEVLKPVGRFFNWLASFLPDAPYARVLLWTVIALGSAALLWALYNRIRHGQWRLRRAQPASQAEFETDEEWRPDEKGARSWLDEADALARDGHFAEAIHHLLFRSIEHIFGRRPALARPALTSRELAASDVIPARARALFSHIALMVERSLFGGRAVSQQDWSEARKAYSDFALPAAWRS
jgi:hypothetical protein